MTDQPHNSPTPDQVLLEAKKLMGCYPMPPQPYVNIIVPKLKLPLLNADGAFDCPECRSWVGWRISDMPLPICPGQDAVGICRQCGSEFRVRWDDVHSCFVLSDRHARARMLNQDPQASDLDTLTSYLNDDDFYDDEQDDPPASPEFP
jgi:hypothetical protein